MVADAVSALQTWHIGDIVPLIRAHVRDADVRHMMYRVQADLELLAEREDELSTLDAVLDPRISDSLVRRAPEWTHVPARDVADYFSRVEELLCALPTTDDPEEEEEEEEDGTTTTTSMPPCGEDGSGGAEQDDSGERLPSCAYTTAAAANRMEEGLRAVRVRASSALVLSCLAVAIATYAVSTYYYYSRCRATFSLSYGGGAEEDLL